MPIALYKHLTFVILNAIFLVPINFPFWWKKFKKNKNKEKKKEKGKNHNDKITV